MSKIKVFKEQNGKELRVIYLETQEVKEGVECDLYEFDGDTTKDLAIVRVKPGFSTPLQRILKGEKTTEGFLGGSGYFELTSNDKTKRALFKTGDSGEIEVKIGDLMQWTADKDSGLTFYEICSPPYKYGRFENLK